eukprot:1157826-Pelagomonas_calceolata.AAC.1
MDNFTVNTNTVTKGQAFPDQIINHQLPYKLRFRARLGQLERRLDSSLVHSLFCSLLQLVSEAPGGGMAPPKDTGKEPNPPVRSSSRLAKARQAKQAQAPAAQAKA